MDVGVRELKQRLSEYLDRVERGEVVRITDRGRPKAILSPIADDGILERGGREGWLSPDDRTPPVPVKRARSRRHVMELLREDRDGR